MPNTFYPARNQPSLSKLAIRSLFYKPIKRWHVAPPIHPQKKHNAFRPNHSSALNIFPFLYLQNFGAVDHNYPTAPFHSCILTSPNTPNPKSLSHHPTTLVSLYFLFSLPIRTPSINILAEICARSHIQPQIVQFVPYIHKSCRFTSVFITKI